VALHGAEPGREPVKYYLVSRNPERDVEGTSHAGERDDLRTVEETLANQWQRVEATELSVDFPPRHAVHGGLAEEVTPTGHDGHMEGAETEPADAAAVSSKADDEPVPDALHDGHAAAIEDAVADMPIDEKRADRDASVDEPVAGSTTQVSTDEPSAAAAAPADEELDQRLSGAFDAQLDRERQELEAEDQVMASREVTDERDAVTTPNEPMTASPEQRPENWWESDAEIDDLTWESDPETERDCGLEM
jgi:hypothetical protein